jgi:hypothetical protein
VVCRDDARRAVLAELEAGLVAVDPELAGLARRAAAAVIADCLADYGGDKEDALTRFRWDRVEHFLRRIIRDAVAGIAELAEDAERPGRRV